MSSKKVDLEEVWRIREEEIFPSLFGSHVRGIFALDVQLFAQLFQQSEIDPRWLTYGVLEFAPTENRNSWLYVTSGHSNPWEQEPYEYDPDGISGAGTEFTLATSEAGEWAIRILQYVLAFDILLAVGRFPGREQLRTFDRISLRAPLTGKSDCNLRNLVVTEAEGINTEFELPSGKVRLAGVTAITDAEMDLAKEVGSAEIIDRLRDEILHPINDPYRRSIA